MNMINRLLMIGVAAAMLCVAPARIWSQVQRLPPIELLAEAPPAQAEAPPAVPEVVAVGPVVPENATVGDEIVPSLLAPGTELGDPPLDLPWYNPTAWFNPKIWAGSYEVGINGSDGNTDTLSLRGGVNISRETALTNWDLQLTYAKTTTGVIETQNNSLLYSNWDWQLPWPKWSFFTKLGLEYDEFKDFNLRFNANTGYGYLLVDTPATQFRPRFGSGTSREFGGVDNTWRPEAVFGADFSHALSPKQKVSGTFDYYPTWSDFSDYRMVSNLNWEALLDEATNLSLKLSLIDRYDSTPNGALPNDLLYSLLLLWKI